jgi:hypothetical protein
MTRHAAPSESLATCINDAERHLLERQRSVRVQGRMLGHRIHERLTIGNCTRPGLSFMVAPMLGATGAPALRKVVISIDQKCSSR